MTIGRPFGWAFLGASALTASQWAVFVLVARSEGPEAAGAWALALAVSGPLLVLFQLKLRTLQVTAGAEYALRTFVAVRAGGMALATMASCAAAALVGGWEIVVLTCLLAASRSFEGLSDTVWGHWQRARDFRAIGLSQVGRALSVATVSLGALAATDSVRLTAGAGAMASLLIAAADVRRVRSDLAGPRPARRVATVLSRGTGLGISGAIGVLHVSIPRYVLEASASRADVGTFSAVAQPLTVGSIAAGALSNIALPRLSGLAQRCEWRAFGRVVGLLVVAGASTGLAAVVVSATLGDAIIVALLGHEYAGNQSLLVWLSVAMAMLWTYTFLGTALDALRRYTVQPAIAATTAIVIAVASLALTPSHGRVGAAWALSIGYAVELVLYAVLVGRPLWRHLRSETAPTSSP